MAVQPSSSSPLQTVTQNVTGLGTIAGAHAGMATVNSAVGLGTAEASVISVVQNFAAELVKHSPHFDERAWMKPFLVLVGAPVAFLLAWQQHPDFLVAGVKTLITSVQGAGLAITQYEASQGTVVGGAMPPVAPDNQYANNPHPWPAPSSPGWGMPASPPEAPPSPDPSPSLPAPPSDTLSTGDVPAAPAANSDAPVVTPSLSTRDQILAVAESRLAMPYRMDPLPDWVQTIDCSSYVILTYEDCALPFEPGGFVGPDQRRKVRTAEQIRAACVPISFDQVQPGDLLFFRDTYLDTNDVPGLDGKIATHIGISYGAGTLRMIDAHGDEVQQTAIGTPYWQDQHLLAAGRHPGLATTAIRVDQSAISAGNLHSSLIYGADLSNYQPDTATPAGMAALLDRLSPRPGLVVVRLGVAPDGHLASLHDLAVGQLRAAAAAGLATAAYCWAYGSADPVQAVTASLAYRDETGIPFAFLAADLEDQTDVPTAAWLSRFLEECDRQGVRPLVYSGRWWWDQHMAGISDFAGRLLWDANYSGSPDLSEPSYGGMRLVAHQFTDVPVDLDVFLPEVCS